MENILIGLWVVILLIELIVGLAALMVWPILLTIGAILMLAYCYRGWGRIFKRAQGRARPP